jgi:flagellum-specific peptidoglycan hydrolase FlgJ
MSYIKRWFRFLIDLLVLWLHIVKEGLSKMITKANYASNDIESKINDVSQGVTGDQLVIEAQSYLHIMGFPIGDFGVNHNGVDGKFGETTKSCLKSFQYLAGYEVAVETIDATILTQLEQVAKANSTIRSLAVNAYAKGIQLSISQESTSAEFVNAIYYYAIIDEITSKVPAAVTTPQAILETGYGKYVPSDISSKLFSYNLFGIKGNGPAGSVVCWTQEENPKTKAWEPVRARFRAYHNFLESIKDHSQFFYDNIRRYGPAFQAKNAADFAKAIAKAGYATDSKYAAKIITLMNYWGLN